MIAWSESNLSNMLNQKIETRAVDHLVQQQMRDLCHNSPSMSMLAAIAISTNINEAWYDHPSQKVLDYWIPKQPSQNGPAAFSTLRSWLGSDNSLKSFVTGDARYRWHQADPPTVSTQLSYDQSLFTCKGLQIRLNGADYFGLAPSTTVFQSKVVSQPVAVPTNSADSSPKTSVRLGARGDSANVTLACKQATAGDKHWDLVKQACDSHDHKEFSKNQTWRSELMDAHSALLKCCKGWCHSSWTNRD